MLFLKLPQQKNQPRTCNAALTLWRIRLRLHCEFNIFQFSESPRIRSAFALSISAFAVESPTSKNFSTGSKIFQLAAQSPWSRTAVAVGSQCIRNQIDGDCAAKALRTHGDCSTTLANAWRLRCESCEVYNGNDVVDCFVINFILRNNEWWKGNGKINNSLIASY